MYNFASLATSLVTVFNEAGRNGLIYARLASRQAYKEKILLMHQPVAKCSLVYFDILSCILWCSSHKVKMSSKWFYKDEVWKSSKTSLGTLKDIHIIHSYIYVALWYTTEVKKLHTIPFDVWRLTKCNGNLRWAYWLVRNLWSGSWLLTTIVKRNRWQSHKQNTYIYYPYYWHTL